MFSSRRHCRKVASELELFEFVRAHAPVAAREIFIMIQISIRANCIGLAGGSLREPGHLGWGEQPTTAAAPHKAGYELVVTSLAQIRPDQAPRRLFLSSGVDPVLPAQTTWTTSPEYATCATTISG